MWIRKIAQSIVIFICIFMSINSLPKDSESTIPVENIISNSETISSDNDSNGDSSHYSSEEKPNDTSSVEEKKYKEVSIYLNPSVQINNIYYDQVNTEAKIMNEIANKMKSIFDEYDYIKTYINNQYLSLSQSVSQSNQLKVDYHLALHSNAGGGKGVEAFTNDVKNLFANAMYQSMTKLGSFNSRGLKKTTSLYEIKNSKSENRVLLELLFHDNPTEALFLVNNTSTIASQLAYDFIQFATEEVS